MGVIEGRPAAFAAAIVAFGVACGGDVGLAFGPHRPISPVTPISSGYGAVRVTTRTSGANVDPDGYVVRVNGHWDYDHAPTAIPSNGTVTLRFLTPRRHALSLDDVAGNCRGDMLEDRAVTVTADSTTAVEFVVTCQ